MPVEKNSPETLGQLDPVRGQVVELVYRKPHRFDTLTVHKIKKANGQKYFIGPSKDKLDRQEYVKKKVKIKTTHARCGYFTKKVWQIQTVASVTEHTWVAPNRPKPSKR